ncbi:MAG: peptide-N-glycosidase F-related protein [Bacteroidaceae bacterium]
MKWKLFVGLAAICASAWSQPADTLRMRLYDEVAFYDGYQVRNNPDKDLFDQDSILRNYTYLYSKKLTDEQLDAFGEHIRMNVWVKACCDNYDRIGNINLALIPKDSVEYDALLHTDTRIELGRFITPFMNKNRQPDVVPYTYEVDYLSHIFHDKALRAKYNFWVEFELFGVPYAANQQVAGCAGRSDVFLGSLEMVTTTPSIPDTDCNVLVPIVMKMPEYMGGTNLNNYHANCTDTIGKTVKTYTFEVPVDVADAQLVLVTSNHGANDGGEEYNRRWHFVYVDDELALTYKPGRTSCEPFRRYNTQSNGIYGYFKMSDAEWQSFSNWCPGDVIDNRIIRLGAVKAGVHRVRISVPDAEFVGKQGFIPVSIFFQGLTEGTLPASVGAPSVEAEGPAWQVCVEDGWLTVESAEPVLALEVYDVQGRCFYRSADGRPVDVSAFPAGLYLANVELADGLVLTRKVVLS